ncbi:ShlB/FhaC/HecB family hemolysin secretion/activation protein [Salmonella enterica subsp. enterica]|nr:ShlB/FhaC/HecB family hemolysin secretion/activation protein [Salmonella enterica subsp. enterica]MKP46098.1 ShlB/FhaC/HecB family hemolysin secretion/activation protein [Salmonella enterica subsp. enterica]
MPEPTSPGTWTTAAAALLLSAGAQALPGDASRLQQEADRLFQQQEQQQKARDRRLAPDVPDIRLPEASAPHARLTFPVEQPCFRVKKVSLSGTERLPGWVPLHRLAEQVRGHCVGVKGVNLLMSTLQNRLISHGWITTRVLAPPQDLSTGELRLQIVPGTVRHVSLTPDSPDHISLYSAVPAHAGELLDIRDIEQGLENLQRLPTVSARMRLSPGGAPGESDIVIARTQSRFWRTGAWVDDSGARSTGRWQGGVMLALDNPTSLSDLFYVTASRDLGFGGARKSTHNYVAHYSVPSGYWLAGVTLSDYRYSQTVAGQYVDYHYGGKSRSLNAQLSRVLHRGAASKTTATYDVLLRETRNFINDTEISGQKRRTSAWRAGLSHRHYLGEAILEAGVSWQRGTRWFGALPAYEEARQGRGRATALSKILTWNASVTAPFSLAGQNFSWSTTWRRQMSHTPLTPQDEFVIGNRWTVRGFDGERTLSGTDGWGVQNTLAWRTPLPSQELYLGADYGEVSGNSTTQSDLTGRHLAGTALGLRGALPGTGISYDISAGMPLSKPSGFKTDPLTTTFSVNGNW